MLLIMILTVLHMHYPHACCADVEDAVASTADQECSPGSDESKEDSKDESEEDSKEESEEKRK